ncbi:neuronal acetylcholine receptor subunit alpha-6-like [Saccostrea echinata]|uniref:neuronal acetylcholine receptor subunit alpha-6-like n=1 Tax=Saccostrea echinata TaxID=191078 RepID=UPI002A817717|nr:neuronal acetylcholine receptor subunit alpha-6-like [Saccostrea echinata]
MFCFIQSVTPQTNQNVQTLISDLFASYSSKVRPIVSQNQPVQLDVSFYLSSINEVNEVKEKLVTTGYLMLSWTDELLRWTPSDYNNTDTIFIPQNDIWKPDLVLKNGFKKFEELGGNFYYLSINYEGSVLWLPFHVFESRCSMDITHFPFDTQKCDIKFITWSHFADQIEITKSTKGIQFYEYETNGVWDIVDTSSEIKKEMSESEVTFTVRLRRKSQYYILNIILPIVFLGYLNMLVFVIPVDAGEKMSFCVTVFLAFAVFLTIISTLLPTTSDHTPILAMYLIVQLIYGVIALIISAFQLRLHHRDNENEIPPCWVKVVLLQRKLRCKKTNTTKVDALDSNLNEKEGFNTMQPNNGDPEVMCEWKHVSSSIDFFAFWSFFISNILITISMFSASATHVITLQEQGQEATVASRSGTRNQCPRNSNIVDNTKTEARSIGRGLKEYSRHVE